jgi:hypothetical protein
VEEGRRFLKSKQRPPPSLFLKNEKRRGVVGCKREIKSK